MENFQIDSTNFWKSFVFGLNFLNLSLWVHQQKAIKETEIARKSELEYHI